MNAIRATRGLQRFLHFTPPRHAAIRTASYCLLASLAYNQTATAGTVFLDNFKDGEAGDGIPVTWNPEQGTWDASSGDYVGSDATEIVRFSTVLEHNNLGDSSVRAQVRAVGSAVVGLGLRRRPGPFGYGATISADGTLRINRVDGRPVADSLGSASVPFNPIDEDVMLQFDAIGGELTLWAWPAGEEMPDTSQLVVVDSTYSTGAVGLVSVATENVSDSSAIYRFVHAADRHIVTPEITGVSVDGFGNLRIDFIGLASDGYSLWKTSNLDTESFESFAPALKATADSNGVGQVTVAKNLLGGISTYFIRIQADEGP